MEELRFILSMQGRSHEWCDPKEDLMGSSQLPVDNGQQGAKVETREEASAIVQAGEDGAGLG